MAKVFLFNPPDPQAKGFTREGRCTQEAGVWATQWPPVSLATIAAFLERDHHEVGVVDFPAAGLNAATLIEMIGEKRPDFAIWATGTPTIGSDLGLARDIKEASPGTITGVLGTHVSALPEEALKHASIDVVVRREPEQPVRNLCLQRAQKWDSVKGISFRDPVSGKIHHNPDENFLPPEDIPFPAWHYFDRRHYRVPISGRPFLIVAPIRGCPYPCNFCTAPIYYGKRLRKRSVKNVVDEIEADTSRYGVRDFFVWADTFTADREYVKLFCGEIISRGLNISWTCNSRVDTIDRDTLVLMKRAGLWMISFGLESGNDDILKRTGKNILVEQSRAAVDLAHRLGLKTSGHFILGLPGETEKGMEETLALALDLPLDIAQFYAAAPFPGTGLYDEALKNAWLRPGTPFSQSHPVMDLPGLPAQKVEAFRKYAYKRFYLRPGTMLKLLAMVEPGLIKNVGANMKRFLRWATS